MKMIEKQSIGLMLGAIAIVIGSLSAAFHPQRTLLSDQALAQEQSEPVQPMSEEITPDDVQASLGCPSEAEMHQNRIDSGVTDADLETIESEHVQRMKPEVLPSGEIIYRASVSTMVISSNGALACYLDSHTESLLNSGEATYIGGPLDNQ